MWSQKYKQNSIGVSPGNDICMSVVTFSARAAEIPSEKICREDTIYTPAGGNVIHFSDALAVRLGNSCGKRVA
jgi:hypothetical protein